MSKICVNVLTYCRSQANLYGNMMFFGSVRSAFPTARIQVFDNNSIGMARRIFSEESAKIDANFIQLEEDFHHHKFLNGVLRISDVPTVFIDPDVVFWENCESKLHSNCLFSGRLLPRFNDNYSRCITQPRIHTSFIFFPNPREFIAKIAESRRFDTNMIDPVMYMHDDAWYRYDTMGMAYAAMGDESRPFDEDMLDRYDHLFCGTHMDLIGDKIAGLSELHEIAKSGDYKPLRGVWRKQQQYLEATKA